MSVPAPAGARPRLSRRSALLGLGALTVAAGCTTDNPSGGRRDRTGRGSEPSQDPDVAVATEALAAQREMHALLTAVVALHPVLGEVLSDASSAHDAHIAMLDGAVPSPAPTSPGPDTGTGTGTGMEESDEPSPGTEAGAAPTPLRPAVPRRPGQALARVAIGERALAVTLKQLAFRAPSGPFARLLGSMAASSAQHSAALTGNAPGATEASGATDASGAGS